LRNSLFPFLICAALAALVPAAFAADAYRPSGAPPVEDILVFGVHPYTNPQDLFEAYEPVMRYLESKVPGVRFQVEAARDYADFEAKLAARRFHFALPNPAETIASLAGGYHVIAKMKPDDDFRGLIVARADRTITAPSELAGGTMCFTSATAVAGTMLPLMYLHDQGVDVKRDIQVRYVGSQFSSILNAASGEYIACGSTSRFFRTWSRKNPDQAKGMQVLWRTPSLPHNAVVARADVAPERTRQVAAALVGMDSDPQLDQTQFRIDQQHFEPANDATYVPVRDFLRRYDRAIGLPASMKAALEKR
jgi:phosphonate transport system substrate-binding protein